MASRSGPLVAPFAIFGTRLMVATPFAPIGLGRLVRLGLGRSWLGKKKEAPPNRGRCVKTVLLASPRVVEECCGRRKVATGPDFPN
jgi:hypothetical protein